MIFWTKIYTLFLGLQLKFKENPDNIAKIYGKVILKRVRPSPAV